MNNVTEIHVVMRELMKLTRMHHTQVESKLKELGIHRSQHMTLMFISKNDGKITQKDIANHYGISDAAVSATVKKLESAEFISKIINKDDARFNCIKLTDKGIKAVKESIDIFNAAEAKTFENITSDELHTLKTIIEKMQYSIKAEKKGDNK